MIKIILEHLEYSKCSYWLVNALCFTNEHHAGRLRSYSAQTNVIDPSLQNKNPIENI